MALCFLSVAVREVGEGGREEREGKGRGEGRVGGRERGRKRGRERGGREEGREEGERRERGRKLSFQGDCVMFSLGEKLNPKEPDLCYCDQRTECKVPVVWRQLSVTYE